MKSNALKVVTIHRTVRFMKLHCSIVERVEQKTFTCSIPISRNNESRTPIFVYVSWAQL